MQVQSAPDQVLALSRAPVSGSATAHTVTQRDSMQDYQPTPPSIDTVPAPDSPPGDQVSGASASPARAGEGGHPPALARFYMTSDLRAATGLTRTHLDFYLRESVILPTARTESGYLLFDDAELATLRQVIAWRQDGVGIRDIRARLARGDEDEDESRGGNG